MNVLAKNQAETLRLFSVAGLDIDLDFKREEQSSDGGLLLLKGIENNTHIISSICNCISDTRDQRYVQHDLYSLFSQRIFQIASGYEDSNDCNDLRNDSVFKICSNKAPDSDPLASQPTMSRFENSVSRTDLYRIAKSFVTNFIDSYEKNPKVIILDCDDTNTNVHGDQQMTFFNSYYGENCYMPLHIYEGLSGKLITTILKPGRRSKGLDISRILKRIIKLLREHWKDITVIIRGDSHFCSSDFMDWSISENKIYFITGISSNVIIKKMCSGIIKSAKETFSITKKPVKMYHSIYYKAKAWGNKQRVIAKIEVNEKGLNFRCIITNANEYRPKNIYELGYCARGNMELLIKEHKLYLKSDRSSCNKFTANQLRLFLHSAAYVLLHSLKTELLKGTKYYNSTIRTIQLKFIKIAANVKRLKTKIKIEFPRNFPVKKELIQCFESL